jgi:hypothetical protein
MASDRHRPVAAAGALLIVLSMGGAGSVAASPRAPVGDLETSTLPGASKTFSMNLYRSGTFVTQYTKKWCVAAAIQIMGNLVRRASDQSAKTQERLFRIALSVSRYPAGGETSESGWARALNRLGYGRYVVRSTKTRSAAIHMAALAVRQTNRPVGLLTWWGAHAWVMHGFDSTADPATTKDFRVTSVYVSDPWYPKVSSIWGPSLPPNSRMSVRDLRVDYIPWVARSRRTPKYSGLFVVVVPVPKPKPSLGAALSAAPSALVAAVTSAGSVRTASSMRDQNGRYLA